jgi:predicted TIM-barrel fold metal-dependent hydrolase
MMTDTAGNSPVIDADGHVFEINAMWDDYAEPKYRDQRPRLVVDDRGTERFQLWSKLVPTGHGRGAWNPEGILKAGCTRNGGFDPHARLKDMTADGIDIAVLYGTISLAFGWIPWADVSASFCRSFNNWLADYCKVSPERLKGVASLPLQDEAEMLKEAKRAVRDLSLTAFCVPTFVNGKNADDPSYYPLYELAQDMNVPIGIHFAGRGEGIERFVDNFIVAHACAFPFEAMLSMGAMICSGVFERFPRLRVAFLEAGAGWLPFWLERLDEHFEKRPGDMPNIKRRPSEYFQEGNCFVSCEPGEKTLPHVLEHVGDDKIFFISDYPHWDATAAPVAAVRGDASLSERAKQRILTANAKRFYGFR